MAVLYVHGQVKKKARNIACDVGTYGIGIIPPGELDHALRVGLILNTERVEKRRIIIVLEAIRAALSPALDKSLFEAQASSPEQAEAEYNLAVARQQVDQSLADGLRGHY